MKTRKKRSLRRLPDGSRRPPGTDYGFLIFIVVLSLAAGYLLSVFFPPRLPKKNFVPVPGVSQKPPLQKTPDKIAFIIDDNGYSDEACRFIQAIPQPMAVAVLPHLPYSKRVAACAHAANKEVMLHLPLEPHVNQEKYPEGYVITTAMSAKTIARTLEDALASVPYAAGVNNHMGSKATEDRATMTTLFKIFRQRGLFFIDSRVTLNSMAPAMAPASGVPFAERDVFLDNKNDRAYIEGQFAELAREARKKGQAIGIGHARALTWTILKEQAQRLEQEGFRVVPVTDILR